MKKVSFVIPSYQSACWLAHAVESCRKQTYANVEIVVVDDASTDTTPQLMEFLSSKDKRINYIRLPKNVGRSEARNIGNKAATGDYLLVLDADDLAYPDRAKLTAEKLRHADVMYGSAEQMDILGNKGGIYQADVFNRERAVKEKLNRIVHSTLAYRKEIAEKFKYLGEMSALGLDDWAFELELAFSGARFDFTPEVIGAYRENPAGISKTRDPKAVEAAKDAFLRGFLATTR